MWPQIAREQLGAGFAKSWELPGSWEPGSLLRKTASWEAILGIKTTVHFKLSRILKNENISFSFFKLPVLVYPWEDLRRVHVL